MGASKKRVVIGVAERVDLPEWGVRRLRAKIDTGARTSALHVNRIEELDDETVRFTIVLHRNKQDERVTVQAPIVRRARVRSSSGRSQERIFVRTRLTIGGVEKEIEVSLASRRRMIFRMLLGRSALGDDFLVDPSRRYVCSKPAPKKKKRSVKKNAKRAVKKKTGKRTAKKTMRRER